VVEAMREWRERYGRLPSSYDLSRAHARARGGEALKRLASGSWPAASVVSRLFGTWAAARAAALGEESEPPAVQASSLGSKAVSLPKPRESTAKTEVVGGGEQAPEPHDLQALPVAPADFAHNSGR
jgi:hypothetical protein